MPQTTLDRVSPAEFRITVTLEPSDYRPRADAELKRLAKTAKIRGFRPGKVPASFLRQTYGRGALAEAIGKSVDEEVNRVLKDEQLDVFGQLESVEEPNLGHLDPNLSESLTFVYEGGLVPTVDEVDVAPLAEVSRYTAALSDAEASEKLDQARRRLSDYLERDTVETEDDFATLVVSDPALDAKHYGAAGAAHSAEPTVGNDAKDGAEAESADHGTPAETADAEAPEATAADAATEPTDDEVAAAAERDPRQKYFLRPADLVEESRYKLVDKARGTEVILALADLKPEVRERFDAVIDADGTTTFTLAKVDRETAPELGPDTYRKLFGEDTDVVDEAGARAAFARRFAENSQEHLDDFTLERLIDALEAANPVPVPARAIKARLEQARAEEAETAAKEGREPDFAHELSEADRHGLGRRLKWMALRSALLKKYGVELAKEDIDAGIEREYRQQIGGMGIDPEQFRDRFFETFRKNLVQNREKMFEITDGLLTAKLLRVLEDEGVLAPRRHVTEAEFSETVEAYNRRIGAELEALRAQPLA